MDIQKNPMKKWIALIIIIVILGGLIAFLLSKRSLVEEGEEVFSTETESVSALNEITLPVVNSEIEEKAPPVSVSSVPDLPDTSAAQKTSYKDGTYNATGNYVSPGGADALGVTLKLKENSVSDVQIEVKAGNPASKNWQTNFSKNISSFVVGKKIDDIKLDTVSGSSLTPVGFMDALSKIKVQAQM